CATSSSGTWLYWYFDLW
nr:immunoglobulin heavy chain junction region [Macaca mulatta]MOX59778.1 immunoglobulin heavy chain junction region [Macaca mulatta]MOX61293.1 immunoglobulin heavy chain junction region [Macaca mulatta]MOX61711.1 immunoglobulin heavy chain junction region [Macaca mulatta]MOX63642.1 immunoglobulin heavy chain junction region [Macaca mulatta]